MVVHGRACAHLLLGVRVRMLRAACATGRAWGGVGAERESKSAICTRSFPGLGFRLLVLGFRLLLALRPAFRVSGVWFRFSGLEFRLTFAQLSATHYFRPAGAPGLSLRGLGFRVRF